MTWKQLKELVDEELKKSNLDDSVQIFYLDTVNYPEPDRIEICADKEEGLTIY